MKFTINKKIFEQNLQQISKAISSKSPLPILQCIKLELKQEGLYLTASDLNLTILAYIPLKTEKETLITVENYGSTLISATIFNNIIKNLDGNTIEIDLVDSNLLKIKDGVSDFNLHTVNPDEYPNIEITISGQKLILNSSIIKDIIRQTIFAVSDKEVRPQLMGVNFKASGGVLECVATDTYRLAKKIITINETANFNIIIPSKTLIELKNILLDNQDVEIFITDKQIKFIIDNLTINSRIINGVYPDVSKLIPELFEYSMDTKSESFLRSLARVSSLSTSNNVAKLSMSSQKIELSSFNQEIGYAKDHLEDCIFIGAPLDIAFSTKYFEDAIRSINKENITVYFNGEMKPFIIKNKNDDNLIQLILPVKV